MNRFNREIEKDALQLRKQYGINGYGIENIFSLVEKMGITLIRYPLGKNTVCGFCTVYDGRKVIVSNTDEILAREIFTIAHEIGHFQYDIDKYSNSIMIDKDIETIENNRIEERANLFAAAFLMPKSVLCDYIEQELEKECCELDSIDIVKIQSEFNVSYSSVLVRLFSLNLINKSQKNKLCDIRKEMTSNILFDMINADKKLLTASKNIYVPSTYYQYVVSNYQKGYVSFDKFKEALKIVNIKDDKINSFRVDEVEDEEDGWDDIDYDYFD